MGVHFCPAPNASGKTAEDDPSAWDPAPIQEMACCSHLESEADGRSLSVCVCVCVRLCNPAFQINKI